MKHIRNPFGRVIPVHEDNDGYKRAIAGEPGWSVVDEVTEATPEAGEEPAPAEPVSDERPKRKYTKRSSRWSHREDDGSL